MFAVLITPRVGFIAAKLIAPTQTSQSVYLEKTALRENFNAELEERKKGKYTKKSGRIVRNLPYEEQFAALGEQFAGGDEVDEQMKPLEEEFRQKFKEHTDEIDRNYQREKKHQEQVGETLSRITPTSSLTYLATNLTQTGKRKRR